MGISMFFQKYQKLFHYIKSIDRIWFIIWFVIYIGFLTIDITMPGFFGATVLKYSGIALCFVYASTKFKNDSLMLIALGFTLLADTVLVIDSTSIIGVFVFCLAQFFHTARFRKTYPRFLAIYLFLVLLVFFIGVYFQLKPMYVLAFIYANALITNIVLAGKWYFKDHSIVSGCAFFGFILFFCCDCCVATSYLSYTAVVPTAAYAIANYFAWFFYYPSQVLISNSSTLHQEKPQNISNSKETVLK